MLCSNCSNFNIQVFRRDRFPYRGYTVEAVISAARAGCSFCSLLLEQLTAADSGNRTYLDIATRRAVRAGSSSTRPDSLSSASGLVGRSRYTVMWLATKLVSEPWVHFSVERRASETGDGLNITHLNAVINLMADSRTFPGIQFHLAADEGTSASISGDIAGRLCERQILSVSCVKAIEEWHGRCRRDHADCSKTLSRTQSFDVERVDLPTRCLKILPSDPDDLESCRWVLCETAGQTGKYMILSHRWGGETFSVRTTRANYAARLAQCRDYDDDDDDSLLVQCSDYSDGDGGGGFQATSSSMRGGGAEERMLLPRFFREACALAQWLGISYIWIDSLCIVQDDPSDWERESVRMADYYQHAWLTVAGTAVDASLERVLPMPEFPRISRLPYRNAQGRQDGHMYVQGGSVAPLASDYQNGVSSSQLLDRGWVYQEWLLSKRLVCFSGRNLYMQCSGAAPSTVAGDEVKAAFLDDPKGFSLKKAFRVDLATTVNQAIVSWGNVVSVYSGLRLTEFKKDRLVALAGVANEFGQAIRALESREREERATAEAQRSRRLASTPAPVESKFAVYYLCGTWLRPGVHLIGLLWEQAAAPAASGARTRVPGIPTWSWASLADVTYEDGNEVWMGASVRSMQCDSKDHTMDIMCVGVKIKRIRVDPSDWAPQFGPMSDGDVGGGSGSYSGGNSASGAGGKGKGIDKGNHRKEAGDGDRDGSNREGNGESRQQERDFKPKNLYGNDNRFAMLFLRGCLQKVRIGPYFGNKDDAKVAATLSGYSLDVDNSMWQAVTGLPARPEATAGWASVDHPDLQPQQPAAAPHAQHGLVGEEEADNDIYALLMSRRTTSGGLAFGQLHGWHVVFDVLFIRGARAPARFQPCYERAGVGTLFGPEAAAAFSAAETTTIWLR